MCSILHRNAILTGDLDAICLACEAHLRGDEDSVMHIMKPIHKKNLEATSFLEKYKDDHVRKVKKGYYCEFCNLFMKTATKVGPHVTEPKHCEKKTLQPFKREGHGILAFDKVHIPENAWHGLTEDTCAVCDAEFANALIHKTEMGHILNLVLAEIEIADGNVYRKVDESTFQCLTCNLVWAQNDMTAHFDGPEHKKVYEECCNVPKILIEEPKKETPETAKDFNQNKLPEKETPKEDKPKKSPAKEISIDDKSKKTSDVKNVKVEETKKKTDTEKKADVKKDKNTKGTKSDKMGKVDKEICEALGATNYITTDLNGQQWCIVCDWSMESHCVQTHLDSRHHQTLLKMHRERAEQRHTDNDEKLNNNDKETTSNEKSDKNSNDVDQKAEQKCKIVDAAEEFQKNNIKLDFVGSSAYCRVCSKSVDFDYNNIKNHIDEHKKKPPKATKTEQLKSFANSSEKTEIALVTSPVRMNDKVEKPKQEKEKETVASSRDAEAETEAYAKENNLVYNKERNTAFCRVCLTKVPPALKNMKEHINGSSHKNKVAQAKVKPIATVLTKEPSHEFIDNVMSIENIFHKDIIVNEKYCVNIYSFFMMTKNGAKLRCQGCETNLTASQVDIHNKTSRHERVINEAPVVTSEQSEFIREIRPNVFHCGFCNQLESPWSTMESHLKSTAHREAKTAANWRLQSYMPDISQHRARQTMQFMLFHRMLLSQMFGDE